MWGLITIRGGYLGDYLNDTLTDALTDGKEMAQGRYKAKQSSSGAEIRDILRFA